MKVDQAFKSATSIAESSSSESEDDGGTRRSNRGLKRKLDELETVSGVRDLVNPKFSPPDQCSIEEACP